MVDVFLLCEPVVTPQTVMFTGIARWSCCSVQFSSVQSLSRVRLFATPGTTARQPSLSVTNSRSRPEPMSIELVMPSNHLILCYPLLLLPSIFPSIRVFSNESALCIRWSFRQILIQKFSGGVVDSAFLTNCIHCRCYWFVPTPPPLWVAKKVHYS